MVKNYLSVCIAVALLMSGPKTISAEESYNFLLPGEFVVSQAAADVTGDTVEDKIYLIGTGEQKSGFANNVNIIVEDGKTKEISRSFLHKVSGYRASLVTSDFNGDKVKDVMFLLQEADMKMLAYVVSFSKAEPDVIYQPSPSDTIEVRSGEVVIGPNDNKKVVRVKKDSTIQLRLPENSSTGYTWQFTQSTGGECVVFLGQQSLIPENDPAMVGKPGLAVFSFKAQQKGTLEMALSNYRSWEGLDSKIESFQVTIEIVE